MKKLLCLFTLFFLLAMQTAWAQVESDIIGPSKRNAGAPITLQGVAIDSKGVPLPDGNRNITFRIYDSPESDTPLWSEQQIVPVEEGIFRAILGEVNALDLTLDQPYWLGMSVGEGEELKPRMQLSAAGGDFRMKGKTTATPVDTKASARAAVDRDGAAGKEGDPDIVYDQVILDDLIVDGSACIGFDCVNGESFGFDTIRLKENNLRIRFVDTSSSASFPSNDWQLTANDSANGGQNKFSIDDIDGGRTPFTIEAGAPSHSLYVDDGGRLGLGTSTPVVDVHIKSGNTPTLRLEQDGSSGFTPQTWDVAGNEANFFIRDATFGSTLPFRIFPGAPSNAITIEASTGDIGLGTTSPDAALHVSQSDDAFIHVQNTTSTSALRTLLKLTNEGTTVLRFENTAGPALGDVWDFQVANGGGFQISAEGSGMVEFIVSSGGLLTLAGYGAGTLMTDASGNVTASSDIRLKEIAGNFDRGLDAILQLEPISYTWKQESGLDTENTYSGFSAQNVQEAIPEAISQDKKGYLSLSDRPIIAALVNAVKELNAENEATRAELDQTRAELASLNSKMSQLESILQLPAFPKAANADASQPDVRYIDLFKSRVDEYVNGVDENGRPKGSARSIQPVEQ